jgi:xanthine dehydrogenase YagS FAD-binding subunit
MKQVSIYRPSTVDEAIQILSHHGTEAGVYAGGTDLLIRLKNRLKQAPSYLVDIKTIQNLRYIKEDSSGAVRIGAATKLSEIAESELLRKRYPMLVEAVGMISSPELRNASTIGGDLLQEVWCQYLRGGYSCWRNGGYLCYGAIGDNSYYHSAMGGRLCYAVYPGDAAVALMPFDARVKLATPAGTKELTLEQLVPGDMMVDGRIQSHVVRFNEILTEVVLPAPKTGLRASFEKLRPRGVWDFAMASLALALQVRDNRIEDSRVAARTSGREFPQRQTAERGSGRSGDFSCSRQRGAAEIQFHQDRHGQGTAGIRPCKAEWKPLRASCSSPWAAWPSFPPSHFSKLQRNYREKDKPAGRAADRIGICST